MQAPDPENPISRSPRVLAYGPVLARGATPDGGAWELRARSGGSEEWRDDPELLSFYLDLQRADGVRAGGFGAGAVNLADGRRPVVLSSSSDKPAGAHAYVGQAIRSVERVELTLGDGSSVPAEIVRTELPVDLWVAFTDASAPLTAVTGRRGTERLGEQTIEQEWPPRARTTTLWGPLDG